MKRQQNHQLHTNERPWGVATRDSYAVEESGSPAITGVMCLLWPLPDQERETFKLQSFISPRFSFAALLL